MTKKPSLKPDTPIAPRTIADQFGEIASMIRDARQRAYATVDAVLVELYWNIGAYISARVRASEWGRSVVSNLADFIQKTIPGPKGFSDKNLWRMKQFYEEYQDNTILSPLVRELGWTQNLIVLGRCKRADEREFYIRTAVKEKWSKRDLERQLDNCLFERIVTSKPKLSEGLKEISPQSEIYFKDSYSMEFLEIPDDHSELELRKSIVSHLKDFVIEFGRDFTFVEEEYRVQVGHTDFFIDLLFFHRELRCLIAIELKIGEFKPEHLGKMNFYLEALDRDIKKTHENPSVGLILCKDKNDEIVEYALSRNLSPLAVADYRTKLPDKKLLSQKLHEFYELGAEEERLALEKKLNPPTDKP